MKPVIFHAVSLKGMKDNKTLKDTSVAISNDIRIEIGNAKKFILTNQIALIEIKIAFKK
jgi:hypothetical protein